MSRPLYCDEGTWIPVAKGLRRRGWEVHTVRDHDRLGATDREHLQFVVENDWLLFTFDDDFLTLVESRDLDHAGIVFANQSNARVGNLVKSLDAFLEGLDEEWRGIHYL